MSETEAEFSSWVLDVARLYSWRLAHFRPARTAHGWRTPVQADGAGFPDLILLRGGRAVAAELKAETGKLTGEQTDWLDAFDAAGIESYCWRPRDRVRIQEILAPWATMTLRDGHLADLRGGVRGTWPSPASAPSPFPRGVGRAARGGRR